MYVEIAFFKEGEFLKRELPFYTKNAFSIFDKAVAKYNSPEHEVLIAMRSDNHDLVKAWGNVKEKPKYGVRLKVLKKSKD